MASSGETLTYGELEDKSNQIAHLFRRLGCQRGDGVAVLMENHPLFLVLSWAAYRSGLYFTAISYRLQPEEVEYIVNDCGAKVLVTSAQLAETLGRLQGRLEHEPACLMVDDACQGAASLEDAISTLPTSPIDDEYWGDRMLYSSGTTGRPKGIRRPLPDAPFGEDNGDVMTQNRYDFDENTVYLSPAPLYHSAPIGFSMTVTRVGGTVVVMERFDAEAALRYIERYRVTHAQWVPTMFVRMLKLPDDVRRQYDLSSMEIAVHAAAPCPIDVKEKMIEWWGPIIHEYYSGTEGNGRTALSSEEWLTHRGSVGRAVVGKLHILDEDTHEELPVGEIGVVYFESDRNFEYHNDPEKTASVRSKQGYTTLGDVGYVDEDGYLYLTDRKSFMIISGGVNIYPQETENALIGHPAVADVAVFGVPNEEFGEEVKAVVQPVDMRAAGPGLEAELIAFCRSTISHIKCPKSIDFLESLPRHPTGKLYKRLLRDPYWSKTP